MSNGASQTAAPIDTLREQALAQVKAKRDFRSHAFIYAAVNLSLVLIWLVTGADGLFWPIFPILGWGIGLAANAWAVYGRAPISEEEIAREEQRLRERGVPASRRMPPG